MPQCQKCGSNREASVTGKTSDLCHFSAGDKTSDGYVPHGVGIGGGDYVEFRYCLDCGQIQGEFPIPKTTVEDAFDGEET